MKVIFRFSPILFLLLYLSLFLVGEHWIKKPLPSLGYTAPAAVHKIISGYLYQLSAELLFIKTEVFLGGTESVAQQKKYETAVESHLRVATDLYPEFVDPYYYAAAYLAPLSQNGAQTTTRILEQGFKAYPDDLILHFFYAYIFNFYLDDPLKASEAFQIASTLPNAPPMFARLAAIFKAGGGDLLAARSMIEIMLKAESDELLRQRYHRELADFDNGILVEKALNAYKDKYHNSAESLDWLVPEFITVLPSLSDAFQYNYKDGVLRLVRPKMTPMQ